MIHKICSLKYRMELNIVLRIKNQSFCNGKTNCYNNCNICQPILNMNAITGAYPITIPNLNKDVKTATSATNLNLEFALGRIVYFNFPRS